MKYIENFLQILSAAGIGSILGSLLTTIIQSWLSSNQLVSNRKFQEKKEAYVGFLEAGHINEIQQTQQSSVSWAYWQARCEVVGSSEVARLVRKIEETNPVNGTMHPNRLEALVELKSAMRSDLAIDP